MQMPISYLTVFDGPPKREAAIADWWSSQEFPTQLVLLDSRDERKAASQPATLSAAARPVRKFSRTCAPTYCVLASQLENEPAVLVA